MVNKFSFRKLQKTHTHTPIDSDTSEETAKKTKQHFLEKKRKK